MMMPSLTRREQLWGLGYTLVSLFLLPSILPDLLPNASAVLLNTVYYVLNFLCLGFLLRKFLRKAVIFAGKRPLSMLAWAAAGLALYLLANSLLSFGINRFFPNYFNRNDADIAQQLGENFPIMVINTVFLVPFAEELMHRGVIFGSLHPKNPIASYLFSAVFFSLVHILGYLGILSAAEFFLSFLQYLPAGLILAWCYQKSGCIFTSVLLHAAINTIGILALR